MSPRFRPLLPLLVLGCASTFSLSARAAEERASDGAANDSFGTAVSLSGNTGLVGAYGATVGGNSLQGAAYVYRNLDTASGAVTENVKLTASDGRTYDSLGVAVSLSGSTGLVGSPGATVGGIGGQGAAYVYRNLDTASGTVTQNVKLTASDGVANDSFGTAVSLSGNTGLVGASYATVGGNSGQGAAYVYRNLDTASGTVTQNVKLTSNDGGNSDTFGQTVSLSGNMGLVGAANATVGGKYAQGAAYLYRNLDTASGTVTQNVKLATSDGRGYDFLGNAVSLSGSTGLVGAYGATIGGNPNQGAAYVYRNLDTASGTVTQNVKLIANDGGNSDSFGQAVSLSGSTGLVGANFATVGGNTSQGAVYLYRNLDTASGTVTENVKLTASGGAANDQFGNAVSLNGDLFTIGASQANNYTGKSYSGTVSSMTTLDSGNVVGLISGLSFVSQDNWIVGQNTSGNQVTLSQGDTANVSAPGKGIFIGQNAGSSNNTLLVQGTVAANAITVGSASGSTGNMLQIANDGGTASAGTVSAAGGITVNPGGLLRLTGSNAVTDRLGDTTTLTLAGGTFDLGGLSEGSEGTTGLGVIRLTLTSTVDFGTTGTANLVQFAGLGTHTLGTRLQIIDWEGTPGSEGGADRLLIAGLATDFAASYLPTDVSFNGIAGYGVTQYTGYYEVYGLLTAVPEPSTWAMLGLGGAGLLGAVLRRRANGAV